jgi:hypothetical protein
MPPPLVQDFDKYGYPIVCTKSPDSSSRMRTCSPQIEGASGIEEHKKEKRRARSRLENGLDGRRALLGRYDQLDQEDRRARSRRTAETEQVDPYPPYILHDETGNRGQAEGRFRSRTSYPERGAEVEPLDLETQGDPAYATRSRHRSRSTTMNRQTDSVPHEPPTKISGTSEAQSQSRPQPRSHTRARQASDSIPNSTRIRAPGSRKTSVTFAPLIEDLVEGSYKYQPDTGTGQDNTGRDRHRERGDRPRTKSRYELSSKRETFDTEEEALGLRVDARYSSPVPHSRSRSGPQPYASQEHGLHRMYDRAPELEETIPNPTPRPRLRYPPAPPSSTSSYYAPSVQGLPRTRRSVSGPVFSPTSPTSPAFSATSSARSPAFRVGRDREPMYAAGERRSHEYERIRDGREIGLSAMQERRLRSGSTRIEEEREEERRARYSSAEQERAGFDLRLGGERNELEYALVRDNVEGRKGDLRKVSLERSLAVTNPSAPLETGGQATSRSAEDFETAIESKDDRPPPIPTKPKPGRDLRLLSHPVQTLPRAPTPTLPSTPPISAAQLAPEPHVDPFVVDQVLASVPDTTPLVRTASAPAVVEETATAALPVDTARLEEMEDEITCPM